jgi:hypothetical protein
VHLSPLNYLQVYPQNWLQTQSSIYPGCYIESCNRMCRLRYRENDGQVGCCYSYVEITHAGLCVQQVPGAYMCPGWPNMYTSNCRTLASTIITTVIQPDQPLQTGDFLYPSFPSSVGYLEVIISTLTSRTALHASALHIHAGESPPHASQILQSAACCFSPLTAGGGCRLGEQCLGDPVAVWLSDH